MGVFSELGIAPDYQFEPKALVVEAGGMQRKGQIETEPMMVRGQACYQVLFEGDRTTVPIPCNQLVKAGTSDF